MFCVVQEIETKKANVYGAYKELKASAITFTFRGKTETTYHFSKCGERFERPIKKAYKFSIHKSYREDGKVKKKQWSLFTIGYYNVIDSGPYDYINSSYVEDLAKELNITEDQFWDMVYKKFDPLREKIEEEFHETEEFKVQQEHERITTIHFAKKVAFEEKYGKDTYDHCYDVFGVLRNEEYLNKLKADYEAQQNYQRSYYKNSKSNYNDYFSSYQVSKQSNYTEEQKEYLKIIYKAAAMKLHPDIKKDNGDGMKFLNDLKDEWGL